MINPAPADSAEDIDPATGLPRQRSADVTDAPPAPGPIAPAEAPVVPPALASVPLEPPPAEGAAPASEPSASDADLAAALSGAGGPDVVDDGTPAIPPNKPLPDMTPTVAAAPSDVSPPAGARQKFTRTLESPEDKAIAHDQANISDAAVTAEQNASQVRQRALEEEARFRAQQTADAKDHQKRVEDAIKEHDAEVEAALAKKQEYFDAARGAKFHDLWAERGAGDRVLGAVAVFLGGLGGGQNQAMQILDTRMKHAYDAQAADIEGKWKLYAETSKDADAAQQGKDEAISNLKLIQSARYEAAADQLAEMKVRQGIPAEQAQSDKDVVAIRQKALAERMQVAKETRDKVEWDTYGKHRGTGGGNGDALTKFVEAAGALKPGDPITPEVAVLGQRAGLKPNQIAGEVDKYRGSGAKAAKLENGPGGGDKAVNDRMNKYEAQAVGTSRTMGPVRVLSSVEAMRNGLDEAVASGDSDRIKAAVIKAKEQAGSLMSGGKLTNAQIKILHELDSSTDEIVSKIGKFTGNPTEGAGAVKRLKTLIDDAGGETLEQIKDIRQRGINEHLKPGGLADTPEKKRTFENRNAGLYSEVKWQGKPVFDEGKSGGVSPKETHAPAKPDRVARAKLANEALSDPAATPAERARAVKTLQDLGMR